MGVITGDIPKMTIRPRYLSPPGIMMALVGVASVGAMLGMAVIVVVASEGIVGVLAVLAVMMALVEVASVGGIVEIAAAVVIVVVTVSTALLLGTPFAGIAVVGDGRKLCGSSCRLTALDEGGNGRVVRVGKVEMGQLK